ncbi:GlsB/YeaQ/YmgE family stress response membrane protein [Klebsiella pneumoniae subsp. pneumoniae]|nr:GlsB/YeaQ/YmgE family stress response membrane protein [Klebsiella pneumoniae subsp. pneumoniae]
MGILSWIIFGLIAGILAKWIMPGKDGGGLRDRYFAGSSAPWSAGWIQYPVWFGKVDGFNFGSFVVGGYRLRWWYCFIYRKVRS